MEIARTSGKVLDAVVIAGSFLAGYGAIKLLSQGVKMKNKGTAIAIGSITLLVSIYALKEAVRKINE